MITAIIVIVEKSKTIYGISANVLVKHKNATPLALPSITSSAADVNIMPQSFGTIPWDPTFGQGDLFSKTTPGLVLSKADISIATPSQWLAASPTMTHLPPAMIDHSGRSKSVKPSSDETDVYRTRCIGLQIVRKKTTRSSVGSKSGIHTLTFKLGLYNYVVDNAGIKIRQKGNPHVRKKISGSKINPPSLF